METLKKFQELLKKLFQFDSSDFGIYKAEFFGKKQSFSDRRLRHYGICLFACFGKTLGKLHAISHSVRNGGIKNVKSLNRDLRR